MPNIREYNSTQALQGIRPNELGADALAQSGRRIASVYHEAGEELGRGIATLGQIGARSGGGGRGGGGGGGTARAAKQAESAESASEIATGSAAVAKAQTDLNSEWTQTANSADLNDSTIGDKFTQDKLGPTLDQIGQGFTTTKSQEWWTKQRASIEAHFGTKIAGDMAARAGDALHVNMDNTLNSFTNGARSDPSSMEHYMDQWQDTVHSLIGTNSNIDVKTASKAMSDLTQKGRTKIAQSAAIGMAERNPDQLLADIDAGKFNDYLDASGIKQVQGYARQQQAQNQHNAVAVSQNSADEYERAQFDPQTGGWKQVTPDVIGQAINDPRMLPAQRKATVTWLQSQMKGQATGTVTSNPQLLANFRGRFAGDPAQYPTQQEIGTAIANGQMTIKDGNELNSIRKMVSPTETKDPASAALFKGALSVGNRMVLGDGTTAADATGADLNRRQRFQSWFYDSFAQGTKAGMTPQQLLTPGSPDYLLKPENMQFFATNGDDLVSHAKQDYGDSAVAVPLNPPTQSGHTMTAQPSAPAQPQDRKPLASFFGSLGSQ